jgi:hypothetical protein
VIAPVDSEPFGRCLPDHFPDATQNVALLDVQVKVAAAPLATAPGVAVSVTVGAGADTVTVVDCAAVPPLPVQVSV